VGSDRHVKVAKHCLLLLNYLGQSGVVLSYPDEVSGWEIYTAVLRDGVRTPEWRLPPGARVDSAAPGARPRTDMGGTALRPLRQHPAAGLAAALLLSLGALLWLAFIR
jgi:hypothetical protein